MHVDNCANLFVQLVGEKEFILCPPGDAQYLVDGRLRKAYATWCAGERQDESATNSCRYGHIERTADGISEEAVLNYAAYDIDNPPPEYAKNAAKLRRTVVRVRPGEVLFLPFGWWHQVRAIPAESGLCASAASFFEPFFVRLQPKSLPRPGRIIPNPKYKNICERLGLADDSDDEVEKNKCSEQNGTSLEHSLASESASGLQSVGGWPSSVFTIVSLGCIFVSLAITIGKSHNLRMRQMIECLFKPIKS